MSKLIYYESVCDRFVTLATQNPAFLCFQIFISKSVPHNSSIGIFFFGQKKNLFRSKKISFHPQISSTIIIRVLYGSKWCNVLYEQNDRKKKNKGSKLVDCSRYVSFIPGMFPLFPACLLKIFQVFSFPQLRANSKPRKSTQSQLRSRAVQMLLSWV